MAKSWKAGTAALVAAVVLLCLHKPVTCEEQLPSWLNNLNETVSTGGGATAPAGTPSPAPAPTEAPATGGGPKTVKIPGWKKERMEKAEAFKEVPADVVISAVLPEPLASQVEFIQLTNMGGQAQDLTGWKLTLKGKGSDSQHVFKSECPSTIEPQSSLLVHKYDATNPCGFKFALGPSEELILFEDGDDAEGMDSMTWGNVGRGWVLYRASDSEYEKAPHNIDGSVMDVLATLGDFKNMIIFLEHFGLDKVLEGKGTKKGHRWFDDIVRDMDTSGPYTLFAIKDDAWTSLFKEMAGEWAPPLTASELLEIDDKMVFDIVSYLMVMDPWDSRALKLKMRDNPSMAFQTAHPDRKAVMQLDNAGKILLNYDCVDSPSPDEFGCGMQRAWGKCSEDWMNDNGFFSGRPLGYCEYECGKCYCDPMDNNCAKAVVTDVTASNGKQGIVHVIDRLIKAPPIIEPALEQVTEEDMKKSDKKDKDDDDDDDDDRRVTWGLWG